MGKITGFMEYKRVVAEDRPSLERVKDWKEFHTFASDEVLKEQGARCMDCGVPFCHVGSMIDGASVGCPVNNLIPEWNDLVYHGRWREAYDRLMETNNFPEFTGRVCPAPCEGSCVLGIHEPPVAIKQNEVSIIEKAFEEGLVVNQAPLYRSDKKVAVVGSGPAGLACAAQLNKAGHEVTVYERADRPGGLLMYGIPNMKLDKSIVNRRIDLMKEVGIQFECSIEVGVDISAEELQKNYDAVVLCGGATKPRDLGVEGRNLHGIYFAMEYLHANTKTLLDEKPWDGHFIDAKGKKVIVIGGGDTGTDCVGTALRQGCEHVQQLEIMPRPSDERTSSNPWPEYPRVYAMDYGQEEAAAIQGEDPRIYEIMTKRFIGENGALTGVETVQIKWEDHDGRKIPVEIPGSEKILEADLVFLAMGFLGPDESLVSSFKVEQDSRSNIKTQRGNYQSSVNGVFTAGDIHRGQSLVVWAIREGREAAEAVNSFLSV